MKKVFMASVMTLIIAFALPVMTGNDFFDTDAPQTDPASARPAGAAQTLKSDSERVDGERTVTVLCGEQTLTMPLSKYIEGVLCAEMPASFPYEALKAQAVAARTYTMYKIRLSRINPDYASAHNGAELCADYSHCSAYRDVDASAQQIWGKNADKYSQTIKSAVADTDGEIMEYNGQPIAAVFHAVSDGKTESAEDVWGGKIPYLVSVDTSGAEDDKNCFAEVKIPLDEFRRIFTAEYPEAKLGQNPKEWFKDSKRSEGGSIINVMVGGVRVSGSKIRSMFALNSADFTVDSDGENFIFRTSGRGHGVGMSQYGARRMALDGQDYREILLNYYTGAKIVKLSNED